MAFDIERIRQDFPILATQLGEYPLVYLDNAATTQKPRAVIDALSDFYCRCNANVHRGSHQLSVLATRRFEQARTSLLHFLKAGPDRQLIWTRGATEGINLVARGWLAPRLQAGDRVLISALEHHANLVPWQQLCKEKGAELCVIPLNAQGGVDLEAFAALLSEKTKLLAVTQVSNALGVVTPVRAMIDQAKVLGVPVLVDGAQAVAHQSVNLESLGADFYVFSGHKLFGPTGIGGLCLKTEWAESMAPVLFGGEMVDQVDFESTRFTAPPLRFEAGTPHMAGAIGLAAAVDYLQSPALQGRLQHEQRVYDLLCDALGQVKGVQLLAESTERQGALSFVVPNAHSLDLGIWLDQYGIAVRTGHHCAMPLMGLLDLPGTVRASVAFYNTEEEVLKLASAVDRWLHSEQVVQVAADAEAAYWQRLDAAGISAAFAKAGPWQKRYRLLMQLGNELESMVSLERSSAELIAGCESTVWLHSRCQNERYWFQFDSDARVIRGLAAVLMAAVNGKRSEDIRAFDFAAYLQELGLTQHLSPSRGNGLQAMLQAVLERVG